MKSKICCIFNYNPLYRYPIYHAMSENFDCDFYFGDSVFAPLKQFDANKLKGFCGFLKAKKTIGGYISFKGIRKCLKKEYTHYIITGQLNLTASWLILFYSLLTRKKVYAWTHGLKSDIRNPWKKIKWKLFYKMCSGVLMYNEYNCKYMRRLGVSEQKLHVIHNSLDTDVQTKLFEESKPSNIYVDHFGNNDPVIVFIGRLQQRMKLEMIVETLELLLRKGKKLNVVFIGAYMDGVNLQKLVSEKNLDQRVWFYGPSFDESKNCELLYNASVCVVPGPIGLTSIHALSYGVPVVTHDNLANQMPEVEAIKDGITGSLYKEGDFQSFLNSIEKWLYISAEERQSVRNAARCEILKNWSVNSQIDLLNSLIK